MVSKYFKTIIFIKSILIILLLTLTINAMEIDNSGNIKCNTSDDIQQCIDKGAGKIISFLPGVYEVPMLKVRSDDTTIIIPKGIVFNLKKQDYPKKDGAIIGIYHKHIKFKKEYKEIKNVTIYFDGIIDGRKLFFEKQDISYEGINIKYGNNCKIIGTGTIKDINGDGIDIDASKYLVVRGKSDKERLKLISNNGNGIHFGSPRPIIGSRNNVIMYAYAEDNGYLHKRNGFDLSWPNKDGAIYINCIAKDNRKNWEINGMGGQVLDSQSINTGKVELKDTFGGASKVIINEKDITNQDFVSTKTKILLKNNIKKFLGMQTQEMLEGIKY